MVALSLGAVAHAFAEGTTAIAFQEEPAVIPGTEISLSDGEVNQGWLEPDLAVAAMLRDHPGDGLTGMPRRSATPCSLNLDANGIMGPFRLHDAVQITKLRMHRLVPATWPHVYCRRRHRH